MCTLSELLKCCATDTIQSMGGSLVSVEKVAKHVTYTTHAVVCSRIPAMAMNILEDIAAGGVYVSHVAKDENVHCWQIPGG